MKPIGLRDPRTGKQQTMGVAQLRMEAPVAWNLVGFQTRLRIPEQQRVFRMICFAEAEFLRFTPSIATRTSTQLQPHRRTPK
jgi:methylenetetrahydrofolate--tRNA-(uracil-5-)-methyltransferase